MSGVCMTSNPTSHPNLFRTLTSPSSQPPSSSQAHPGNPPLHSARSHPRTAARGPVHPASGPSRRSGCLAWHPWSTSAWCGTRGRVVALWTRDFHRGSSNSRCGGGGGGAVVGEVQLVEVGLELVGAFGGCWEGDWAGHLNGSCCVSGGE